MQTLNLDTAIVSMQHLVVIILLLFQLVLYTVGGTKKEKEKVPYQPSSGIITATGGQTAEACVHDGAAEQQADDAAQQDGGVGPLHYPMEHKGLRRGKVSRSDLTDTVTL